MFHRCAHTHTGRGGGGEEGYFDMGGTYVRSFRLFYLGNAK